MDSYVVSCKYAEPQFPPCEEDYSNFSDQGGFYNNNPQQQDSSGTYGGGYQPVQPPPPPPYTPQQTGYQQQQQQQHSSSSAQGHDAEELPRHQAAFPGYRDRADTAELQYHHQAWVTCTKQPAQVQRKAACQGRDKPPVVVYPWMKKVHVAHGEKKEKNKRFITQHPSILSFSLPLSLSLLVFWSICARSFCCRVIYELSESPGELQPL